MGGASYGRSREKARADLRSPFTLAPESHRTGISKFWPNQAPHFFFAHNVLVAHSFIMSIFILQKS